MTVSKTWYLGFNNESEYPTYYAPHIAADLWIEYTGVTLYIHYSGTTIKLTGKKLDTLRGRATQAISDAGIADGYASELIIFTITEHVVASLMTDYHAFD